MKNTKRIFICALCIILSVIVASATLMAGATDVINESTTAAASAEATEKTTIPATEVISTTEKPIEDSIKDFVSENDLQDDLNEIGGTISADYQLDVEGRIVSRNSIEITLKEV